MKEENDGHVSTLLFFCVGAGMSKIVVCLQTEFFGF